METTMFFFQANLKEIQQVSFDNGELYSYMEMAFDKKEIEDSMGYLVVDNKIKLIIMADGMGGHSGGAKASRLVFEYIEKNFKNINFTDDLSSMILNTLEEINLAIKDLKVGAGTTINIIEVNKDYARSYHAGDSESFILGSRGAIKYITQGHSPYAYVMATDIIDDAQMDKIEKNVILNGLGFPVYWINVSNKITISDNDILFSSSDHFPELISRDELIHLLTSGNFENRAESLVKLAHERQPEFIDDSSFILFKVKVSL